MFKEKRYADAAECYRDGLNVCDSLNGDDTVDIINVKVALNQNLAMCLNYTEDYDEAIYHCGLALALKPDAAKAMFI